MAAPNTTRQSPQSSVSEIRPGSGKPRFEATYREDGPHSYYRDLVAVSVSQLGNEDPEPWERLARHRRRDQGSAEYRDVPRRRGVQFALPRSPQAATDLRDSGGHHPLAVFPLQTGRS
jgi:hypothetical protein